MLGKLFNQINLIEKGLDASWKKNEVIANNIANADTPGFKASHVEFESVFREFLNADSNSFFSQSSNLSTNEPINSFAGESLQASGVNSKMENPYENSLNPIVTTDPDSAYKLDGNGVDMDSEMSELTKNAVLYDTMSYALSKEINRLKIIINDGR